MRGHVALAELHAFVGDMDKSIKEWQSAYQIAQSDVPGAIPYMQEALGVSYLHLSEMENGVYRESGSIDIFPPLHPGAHFDKPENSRLAIQYFLSFLELAPEDLQVRWLLNLAYVTLGEYPAGVPPKYLVPASPFESKESVGRFTDVARAGRPECLLRRPAAQSWMTSRTMGLLDVITSSWTCAIRCTTSTTTETARSRIEPRRRDYQDQLGGLNIIQADYNNDGCMDILVLRGGWEFPMRKSLLRNNCDGTFTDVTRTAASARRRAPTQTAAWADIDNDGYLDLFIGNENAPSQLFRNKGDGTFEDISHAAGIDKTAFTKGVVAADYDKDGYVDFYVSNFERRQLSLSQ